MYACCSKHVKRSLISFDFILGICDLWFMKLYYSIFQALDWEVELAVVIGKQGKDIPKSQALDYVFGYTVAQDISARDWQKGRNNGQWLLCKSMDTFCPLGPAVVMKEYLPDPNTLSLCCSVNDVMKQNASTEEFIFKVDDIIAYISQ